MKIAKAHFPIAAATALALSLLGCQTAQRPASTALPAQATAPALVHAAPQLAPAPPAQVSQSAPQPPEAKPDLSADLIAQVEKEFQAGQDNYNNGHLEAAKQNFDNAFNLLMSSPLDLRSDDRLQKEFDRVVDGVNGLELQALQEGDGFNEPQSEPAPIDEANDITYPVDPNI